MTKSLENVHKLFYRPDEAADALGCCRRTIYNYATRGRITIEKIEGLAVIPREQLIGLPRARARA